MADRVPKHRVCPSRPRYQKGCQCPDCVAAGDTAPHLKCVGCKKANTAYISRNRTLKEMNGGVLPAGVKPPAPGEADRTIRVETDPEKLVEHRVQVEIDLLQAGDKMPGIAAGALAMGRVLDDPTSVAQHSGAFGQLLRAMIFLRKGGAGAQQEESALAKKRRERAERAAAGA